MSALPRHPDGTARPVRVMVVDDSASMRAWLSYVIDQDPRLNVVAQAADALEARTLIKAVQPDVLTLDLAMPQMNGLDFLAHLMRLRPMPVIVFSGLIANQGNVAAAAKKLGAFACIPKPASPDTAAMAGLREQLLNAGAQRDGFGTRRGTSSDQIILVGASTGGVAALEAALAPLPTSCPPIVVAQHMPQRFLESFVERLDRILALDVQLANSGAALKQGTVYFAQARSHQTCVNWHRSKWSIVLEDRRAEDAFCPSVNHLFLSAVPWADRVGALLLTGIGKDGAEAMLSLSRAGARTVGQSSDSCVVYGMPGAAQALGAVETEASPEAAVVTLLQMMEPAS